MTDLERIIADRERDVAAIEPIGVLVQYEDGKRTEKPVRIMLDTEADRRLAALGGPSVALARAAHEALDTLDEWRPVQGQRLRAALLAWAQAGGERGKVG